MRQIIVLGTLYKIIEREFGKEDIDGFCDYTNREIHIRTDNINDVGNFERAIKKQLRHEIIHAFLAESGLQANFEHTQQFGHEETMVDWVAIQFPKLLQAFKDADCI